MKRPNQSEKRLRNLYGNSTAMLRIMKAIIHFIHLAIMPFLIQTNATIQAGFYDYENRNKYSQAAI